MRTAMVRSGRKPSSKRSIQRDEPAGVRRQRDNTSDTVSS